jgi:hypothetical protein
MTKQSKERQARLRAAIEQLTVTGIAQDDIGGCCFCTCQISKGQWFMTTGTPSPIKAHDICFRAVAREFKVPTTSAGLFPSAGGPE